MRQKRSLLRQKAAKIEVTSAQGYNKVLLSNVVYDGDLNNKTYNRMSC